MPAKTEISVGDLVIEITRRCNMRCDHCLRGDARNLDMPESVIDEILDAVDEISIVTFTGGEPSINLPIMEYFFRRAKAVGKFPNAFFVATNGHENQPELARILLEAWQDCADQDACGVALSEDGFHDGLQSGYVRGLKFYQPTKERSADDYDKWVIASGRAAQFGFGREPITQKAFSADESEYPDGTVSRTVDTLYVAADGFVYPDCDLAYDIMDLNRKLRISSFRDYLFSLDLSGRNEVPAFLENM